MAFLFCPNKQVASKSQPILSPVLLGLGWPLPGDHSSSKNRGGAVDTPSGTPEAGCHLRFVI